MHVHTPNRSSMWSKECKKFSVFVFKLNAFKVGFTPQDDSESFTEFEIISYDY